VIGSFHRDFFELLADQRTVRMLDSESPTVLWEAEKENRELDEMYTVKGCL